MVAINSIIGPTYKYFNRVALLSSWDYAVHRRHVSVQQGMISPSLCIHPPRLREAYAIQGVGGD